LQLEPDGSPGQREYTLELGFHGSGKKLAYFFKNTSLLRGSQVVGKLAGAPRPSSTRGIEEGGVIAKMSDHKYALNLVHTWDTYGISIVIMIPIVFRLFTTILWTVVAAKYYHADVNASAQTGFTIGSYVVTAGRLLSIY
jgi:hypothetical protein